MNSVLHLQWRGRLLPKSCIIPNLGLFRRSHTNQENNGPHDACINGCSQYDQRPKERR